MPRLIALVLLAGIRGAYAAERDSAMIVSSGPATEWRACLMEDIRISPKRIARLDPGADLGKAARRLAARAEPRETLWFIVAGGKDLPVLEILALLDKGRQGRTVALIEGPLEKPKSVDPRTILVAGVGAFALDALRGRAANPDGAVTAWSLTDYARQRLQGAQTPELLAGSPGAILVRRGKAAAETLSVPRPKNPPGDAGLEWIKIPGGTFSMGSESGAGDDRPVHQESVKDFELARSPVTFGQYHSCVAAGACTAPHVSDGKCHVFDGKAWHDGDLPAAFAGPDQPAVCVDWAQAAAFSAWAGGRLPTEAEWEYAARGGGKTQKYPWGDAEPDCERTGCGAKATAPVCSRPKGNTAHGLCDMAGNVVQWVSDAYRDSYERAAEGIGRAARGSSWSFGSPRCSSRNHVDPGDLGVNVGFRPARQP